MHGNGFGQRLDKGETLLFDDLLDRFVNLRVVDRQTQVILLGCRTRVHTQVDIDFETLSEDLLFRIDAVAPVELHVAQTDEVATHPHLLLLW